MTEIIKANLIGISTLLMHNGRLANPTDKWTKALKEVTSKKKKTEEDHLEIKKMEWRASLYMDEDETFVGIPSDVLRHINGMAGRGFRRARRGRVRSGMARNR